MKTFHNVVDSLICCAKERPGLIEWVQTVLQNCEIAELLV